MHPFIPAGGGGHVVVYDGSNQATFEVDWGTKRITFPQSGAPAAGKTLAGYIPVINANGTNYYMAVYT